MFLNVQVFSMINDRITKSSYYRRQRNSYQKVKVEMKDEMISFFDINEKIIT